MEVLGAAFLIGSGMYLNSKDDPKSREIKKAPIVIKQEGPSDREIIRSRQQRQAEQAQDETDRNNANRTFRLQFFKKKEVTNPGFDESSLWNDLDEDTMGRIKSRVDISKNIVDPKINDVGFDSSNSTSFGENLELPSIDDIDRDDQFIHSNMQPFFGSTVKQNVNDTSATQLLLELNTGNFRHTRRDNKTEVEYLFDPTPNNQVPFGANSNSVTNRDQTRFFPSATGKKHNDLPFEQIQVGKGIANGYTARPNGGLQGSGDEVRILPKTTEDLRVNPKITYEGRVLSGKATTEKGKLMGRQTIKQPRAIVYNHNGERNFTGLSTHKKNRQRPDIIFKCTNRDKQHREYKGIAAPTTKSKNTPDGLRGKKKLGTKRNFIQDWGRNLVQAVGKKINDFSKSGFENKPTERSIQSTRTHYTNVTQVGGKRGQQYSINAPGAGLRYTRKQDLIANRPGSDCGGFSGGKAGPVQATRGPAYNNNETAKTTIRETTENNRHHGFVGRHERKGPAYDEDETARTTVRETTENNRHHGFVGRHERKGPAYAEDETARTTIRETTENNRHHGFVGKHERKGPAYDENETARVTIRETTENNRHNGNIGAHERKGPAYDQNETAKVTIKETTENNRHHGFVGRHERKGRAYDQCETARKTIKETTEDNKYIAGVSSGALQNGGGYQTTKWEAKNPQKAYLCDREYVGGAEATSNKAPKSYAGEYQVNTNKEQIAVGRTPTQVKNFVANGKEGYNICINKLDLDREVPHVLGKGTSLSNTYNSRINLTTRKNVTPGHVDRLHVDTLDAVKNNPLQVNQNLN